MPVITRSAKSSKIVHGKGSLRVPQPCEAQCKDVRRELDHSKLKIAALNNKLEMSVETVKDLLRQLHEARQPSVKGKGGAKSGKRQTVIKGRGAKSAKLVRAKSVKGSAEPGCSSVRKYIGKPRVGKLKVFCGTCVDGPSYPVGDKAHWKDALSRAHDAGPHADAVRRCANHYAFQQGWINKEKLVKLGHWHDSFAQKFEQSSYNGKANSK